MKNNEYGYHEVGGLKNGQAYHSDRHKDGPPSTVDWTEPGLYITRLRLVSDLGHPVWDVSYCHGILEGRHVDVCLPFSELPKKATKAAIVDWAKKEGFYAASTGILDNISTLQ